MTTLTPENCTSLEEVCDLIMERLNQISNGKATYASFNFRYRDLVPNVSVAPIGEKLNWRSSIRTDEIQKPVQLPIGYEGWEGELYVCFDEAPRYKLNKYFGKSDFPIHLINQEKSYNFNGDVSELMQDWGLVLFLQDWPQLQLGLSLLGKDCQVGVCVRYEDGERTSYLESEIAKRS